MRSFVFATSSVAFFFSLSSVSVAHASPTPIPGSTSNIASTVVACADNDNRSSLTERTAKGLCVAGLAEGSLDGLWGDTSDDAVVGAALADWAEEEGLTTGTPGVGVIVIDGETFPAIYFSPNDAAHHGVPAMALSVRDLDLDGEDDLAVIFVGNTGGGAVHSQKWTYFDIFGGNHAAADEAEFAYSIHTGSSGNNPVMHHYAITSAVVTDFTVTPADRTQYDEEDGWSWSSPRYYTGLSALQ